MIGAEALASCILTQGMHSLEYLGLSYNSIKNDGAIALADVIRAGTNLRILTLKNNSIGSIGLAAISSALADGKSNLERLALYGNDFDHNNGMQYMDLIQHRLQYTGLGMDIVVYEVDGVCMIAEN